MIQFFMGTVPLIQINNKEHCINHCFLLFYFQSGKIDSFKHCLKSMGGVNLNAISYFKHSRFFRIRFLVPIWPHDWNVTWASQVALAVKELPCQRGRLKTWVWSLRQEDPLKGGMATHSSILAWRIPWTEEPGRPQSIGAQRVGHDWSSCVCTHTKYNLKELILVRDQKSLMSHVALAISQVHLGNLG